MKHFFSLAALFMLVAFSAQTHAQDVLGCTTIYADNYNPDATINDGTCNYDLSQLLGDDFCIGELLNGGVLWQDFHDVSYQGGVIVHVNEELGKALVCDEDDFADGSRYFCMGVLEHSCWRSRRMRIVQWIDKYRSNYDFRLSECPSAAQAAYLAVKDGYVDWFANHVRAAAAYSCQF